MSTPDSLTAKLTAALVLNATQLAANRSTGRNEDQDISINLSEILNLTLGSAASKITQYWQDKRSLAASTGEFLNISGGAHAAAITLVNDFGANVVLTKIRFLLIVNTHASNTLLVEGGHATDGFSALFKTNVDGLRVQPGGVLLILDGGADATGYAVATDEVLKITNEGGSSATSYQIYLGGV